MSDLHPVTRIRRRVYPTIHEIKDDYGGFAAYTLSAGERAALIDKPLWHVYDLLRRMGYSLNPIAALKSRNDANETLSAGSWRKIDPQDPEMQYHVTLFDLEDGVEVNCHWEFRWEPWTPTWDWDRPRRHYYTGEGGIYEHKKGVRYVRQQLDEHGVDYADPEDYKHGEVPADD